mgnify:CR=1 FL=1
MAEKKKKNKTKGPRFFNDAKATYVPPTLDFKTSTTVWNVDEQIRKRYKHWRMLLDDDGVGGSRANSHRKEGSAYSGTYSVFPAPLAEWIYLRYAGEAPARVFDPFSGGPPRGAVAAMMGHEYHGVDIRREAVDECREVLETLGLEAMYHVGDARNYNPDVGKFDFSIACPPYYNLEVYSDQEDDLSNLGTYKEFLNEMKPVAKNTFKLLKEGAFCALVVGNFRQTSKKKNATTMDSYITDFRGDMVRVYKKAGFRLFQDIVLKRSAGSAAVRAGRHWSGGMKLVAMHEYLLIFRKPTK